MEEDVFSFDNSLYISRVTIDRAGDMEDYVSNVPAVAAVMKEGFDFRKRVTVIMGENGTGKSTLLEAIAAAYGFNPEGGTKNFTFSTYSSHSRLYENVHLIKGWRSPSDGFFFRAESYYNVASDIERMDGIPASCGKIINAYGGVSLHEQSHGESFMALALNRFSGKGLYILDEPEAALSPSRQMALLVRLRELAEDDSQLIIATHSVILSAMPDADLIWLSEDGIKRVNYTDTEHYNITKHFIDSPDRMIKYLTE